ncbi:MAG: CAP domain-containing protein, partial [Actinomycetota bacterium]|nr:CAP domain-containing protein [Actinomycetota bacterium]
MTRTARSAVGVCAAALMVFGVVTWAAFPAGAQTVACSVSAQDQAIDAEEQALLGLVNQYRQANGKNALAMHADVTRAAAWLSRDMATRNYFPYNHIDSNGRGIDQRLTWCGVSFSNWAENIYAGSPGAQAVFDAWRASSTHNTNMLRDGVTSAGIARAYDAGSTYSWYWTLDLTNSATGSTSTTRPVTTTTPTPTTPPSTGPAPGTPEWYA